MFSETPIRSSFPIYFCWNHWFLVHLHTCSPMILRDFYMLFLSEDRISKFPSSLSLKCFFCFRFYFWLNHFFWKFLHLKHHILAFSITVIYFALNWWTYIKQKFAEILNSILWILWKFTCKYLIVNNLLYLSCLFIFYLNLLCLSSYSIVTIHSFNKRLDDSVIVLPLWPFGIAKIIYQTSILFYQRHYRFFMISLILTSF
jgi:hypothetical protein